MKKFLSIIVLLAIACVGVAQPITDSSSLRTRINTDIVPNNTKQITASQLNRIMQGYLNIWPKYSWMKGGNPGTVAGTDFLGTPDSVSVVFKTNGIERARMMAAGNVGIGTATPIAKLTVSTANVDSTINDANGITIENPTLSTTLFRTQWTPRLRFRGHAFKSIGSVDNTMDFAIDVRPATGANITGTLNIGSSINGVTYKKLWSMTDRGILTDSIYGNGGVTGTPAYDLVVDATGKFLNAALPPSSVTKVGYEMASLTTGVLNVPRNERTGLYLSVHKTYMRRVPQVTGTTLMTLGSSYAAWNFCQGTNPYTRLATLWGKIYYTAAVNGADLNVLINSCYPFGTFGTDTTVIIDVGIEVGMLASAGQPYSGIYYTNDHFNDPVGASPKTKKYIYEGYKALLATIYLDNDWFAASTLSHVGFRTEVASDSVASKSTSAIKGVGTISFTKPAGKTSVVIMTRGADSIRQRLGTIAVNVGGVNVYSKYFNGENDANRAPGPIVLKVGLNYEAIILKGLPDSAATVNIVCSGTGTDSCWLDAIGYLKSPDKPSTNLYINSIGYGTLYNYWVISNVYTDTCNLLKQKAVEEFAEYPVFIQNTNAWYDSTLHNTTFFGASPAPFHLTATAGDSIYKAYSENVIVYNYNQLQPAAWTTNGTGANRVNGNVGIGTATPSEKLEIFGNLKLGTAGNKIKIATGSNASAGTATLSSGTVTINTTAVTANSLIFVVYNTPSGTLASGLSAPVGSIVAGTSFVINSLTTAGVVNTLDNSTVRWWFIN